MFQAVAPTDSALGTQHAATKTGEFEIPGELERGDSFFLLSTSIPGHKNELCYLLLIPGKKANIFAASELRVQVLMEVDGKGALLAHLPIGFPFGCQGTPQQDPQRQALKTILRAQQKFEGIDSARCLLCSKDLPHSLPIQDFHSLIYSPNTLSLTDYYVPGLVLCA